MCASHDGLQQLVGIAGNASCLIDEVHRAERELLAKKLQLKKLEADAWNSASVRAAFGNDRRRFLDHWTKELSWIPNWRCPESHFFWLKHPITLDPKNIRGARKLLTMFGSYTKIDVDAARRIMKSVPDKLRTDAWDRIYLDIGGLRSDAETDIYNISIREDVNKTTRKRLIDARRGQGLFRSELDRRWKGACSASGCNVREVLRASHIKPWRECDDKERLDPANGLLLAANLDCLFDKFLISFEDDGKLIISKRLERNDLSMLNLPDGLLRKPVKLEKYYLKFHRQKLLDQPESE